MPFSAFIEIKFECDLYAFLGNNIFWDILNDILFSHPILEKNINP